MDTLGLSINCVSSTVLPEETAFFWTNILAKRYTNKQKKEFMASTFKRHIRSCLETYIFRAM